MNNAKMWLVVKPSVGVPIFLSAVAIGSFSVHVAVLSNTSWVSDFLSGVPLGTGDQAALQTADPEVANASYAVPLEGGAQEVTVILPDGTVTSAILHAPNAVATPVSAPPSQLH